METVTLLNQDAANSGAEIYTDWADPNAELRSENPFHEHGPIGETLLEWVKELGDVATEALADVDGDITSPKLESGSAPAIAIYFTRIVPNIPELS